MRVLMASLTILMFLALPSIAAGDAGLIPDPVTAEPINPVEERNGDSINFPSAPQFQSPALDRRSTLIVDTDSDGSPDDMEYLIGTDPKNPDTDSDGLSDGREVELGINPFASDSDNDMLDDLIEIRLGTDPSDPDTDGDHMMDGWETGGDDSTNPLMRDSDCDGLEDPWEDNDGDGILNMEEAELSKSNPNAADSDRDGIGDEVEIQLINMGIKPPIIKDFPNADEIVDDNDWNTILNASKVSPIRVPDRDDDGHDIKTQEKFSNIRWWWSHMEDAAKNYHVGKWNKDGGWQRDDGVYWRVAYYDNWEDGEHGSPLKWNRYDIHPGRSDTDLDGLPDSKDPNPLQTDDRLDAFVALASITPPNQPTILPEFGNNAPRDSNFYVGEQVVWPRSYKVPPSPIPQMNIPHNLYGFPYLIGPGKTMDLNPNLPYTYKIYLLLEKTAAGTDEYEKDKFSGLKLYINFFNMNAGNDSVFYTPDDDLDGDGMDWAGTADNPKFDTFFSPTYSQTTHKTIGRGTSADIDASTLLNNKVTTLRSDAQGGPVKDAVNGTNCFTYVNRRGQLSYMAIYEWTITETMPPGVQGGYVGISAGLAVGDNVIYDNILVGNYMTHFIY